MKIYITKYALTTGIMEKEGIINPSRHTMAIINTEGGLSEYYHGKDWYRTHDDAIARANEMRQKKVSCLLKQISKIESIKF